MVINKYSTVKGGGVSFVSHQNDSGKIFGRSDLKHTDKWA